MATETKKVSKLDTVLNKIDAFFEGLMSSKKSDDMEEDDDMGAEDEDTKKGATVEAPAAAKKAKKATDDEDSQDPDDDGDDDTDPDKDDDDDAYSKKATSEIAALKATIAKQNTLLKEAKTQLEQKDEDVREEIKSTFKPAGSQRSTKTSAVKTELPSWATPKTEMAQRAAKLASAKK